MLKRFAQNDTDVLHVPNNPYASPKEPAPIATARPCQRDALYVGAGCFGFMCARLHNDDRELASNAEQQPLFVSRVRAVLSKNLPCRQRNNKKSHDQGVVTRK